MAQVRPFKCVRPAANVVDKVAALPYDVYNRAEAKQVVEKNPISFLAIDRAETQFDDSHDMYADDVYEKARELADIVVVFPHWGEEYKTEPNSYQRHMAQVMADAGADLIIGCHPHVIQPLEILISEDGREVPCYYSLGNFISNMPGAEKNVEAMAKVRIKKDGDQISIDYAEAVPMVNYYDPEGTYYTVYMAEDFTDEISRTHRNPDVTPRYVENFFNSVFTTRAYHIDNDD